MSRSTCPDCARWRCICLADEAADNPPQPAAPYGIPGLWRPQPHRPAPCPPAVWARLQELRAEFAERAGAR